MKEFAQITWDDQLQDDCRQLTRLAVREDLGRGFDLTTVALIDENAPGRAALRTREPGVIAGLAAVPAILDEMEVTADWTAQLEDGAAVNAGDTLAEISASARDLLTSERLLLNLVGRLSGIATATRRYVDAIGDTNAKIYDTRKTTPGWRRLEKYAVRCGGGCNHRTGLFDAVLIKDNHLALMSGMETPAATTAAAAVTAARRFVLEMAADRPQAEPTIVEIELDSLEGWDEVIAAGPDIILLDNMSPGDLRRAVARRDELNPNVELEASGGINLDTVRSVAETGVDRISVGALTHSAVSLDIGLDWLDCAPQSRERNACDPGS